MLCACRTRLALADLGLDGLVDFGLQHQETDDVQEGPEDSGPQDQ